ncbi:hypothetical protein H072_8740 [Dactylellina haptotyla CBS 200.50]|uniref:Uncharacterized protein n=1 Tax=Dactylellina haptotyla (strain CBS 200.50) TaxID=1284197 RepID=S8BQP7_DACHA|nr:hypothetical protein H072_8740 [Dactylellina haptotyla CBS 200.50]
MSLFHHHKHNHSKSSSAVGQDPEMENHHHHHNLHHHLHHLSHIDLHQVIKKKRTFFRGHTKAESSASIRDVMTVPRDAVISSPLQSPTELGHHDAPSQVPQRRASTTRRLQKRPPSTAGPSSPSRRAGPSDSPASSPSYVLDKPPQISGPDFTPAHQNLYIMEDGQDDEMYTLFEIINGNKPMDISDTQTTSTSAVSSPELPMESQRAEFKKNKSTTANPLGHSRNTSASSAYSTRTSGTYETEFTDFHFDFSGDGEKNVSPISTTTVGSEALTFHKRHGSIGIISERVSPAEVKNEYDDCVESIGDLTTDDESEFDDDEEWDDVVLEEGLAIQMSISKFSSPLLVVISPRSSCEL